MPTVERDGVALAYETAGDGEPVAFVGDAGLGAWSWGWQFRAVGGPFEAVVADLRGTGRSDAPPGPYQLSQLATDLRAVLADAGAHRPHLVGLGLGGLVALEYALARDVRSLALVGTAAAGDAADRDAYERALAPPDDPGALRASLAALLSPPFRERHPDVVEGIVEWREADDARETGRAAQLAALDGFDARDRLHEVTAPALVLHGGDDELFPPTAGERLAEGLPRGEHRAFPDAGHLVTVERSRSVNDALVGFLEAQT